MRCRRRPSHPAVETESSVRLVVTVSTHESGGGCHFCGRVARLAMRQRLVHVCSPRTVESCVLSKATPLAPRCVPRWSFRLWPLRAPWGPGFKAEASALGGWGQVFGRLVHSLSTCTSEHCFARAAESCAHASSARKAAHTPTRTKRASARFTEGRVGGELCAADGDDPRAPRCAAFGVGD